MRDIKISQILDDLERGLSREDTSPDFNSELGSIKTKYNLSSKELKYLFSHPQLKGKRTKLPVMFNLVDDVTLVPSSQTLNEGLLSQIRRDSSEIGQRSVLDAMRAATPLFGDRSFIGINPEDWSVDIITGTSGQHNPHPTGVWQNPPVDLLGVEDNPQDVPQDEIEAQVAERAANTGQITTEQDLLSIVESLRQENQTEVNPQVSEETW